MLEKKETALKLKPFLKACALLHVLTAFVVLSAGCSGTESNLPSAVKGTIDLSGCDFKTRDAVKLSGDWIFLWNEFAGTERLNSSGARFVRVPGVWNNIEISGSGIGGYGYATYALRVIPPAAEKQLAVKIGEVSSAWDLYAGDQKIASSGKAGKDKQSSSPSWNSQIIRLPAGSDPFYLIMHVSNFHYYKGGPYKNIYIAPEKNLMEMRQSGLVIELSLFALFLMAGLYHLAIFYFRRSERAPLYFGILCLLIGIYNLTTGEIYFNLIFPSAGYEAAFKLVFLSVYPALLFLVLYLESLYSEDGKFIYRKILAVSTIVLCGITIAAPITIFSKTLPVFHALTVMTAAYSLWLTVKAIKNKKEGALVVLGGIIIVTAAAVNDIIDRHDIAKTRDMIPFGSVVMILSQGYLLAAKHSRAERERQSLANELSSRMSELEETKQYIQTERRAREESRERITPSVEAKLAEAISYIENNYHSEISREGLAAHLGLHPDNFGRFFKIHTGKKPVI